jgi:hypothetical protein
MGRRDRDRTCYFNKEIVMTNDDTKKIVIKLLVIALSIIIALVGTVWAITWNATDKIAREAAIKNNEQDKCIATLEANYANIQRQLDLIYKEVKK